MPWKTLLKHSADLSCLLLPDDRIEFAGRDWEKTLGYPSDELARIKLPQLLAPGHEARTRRLIARQRQSPRETIHVLTCRTREGAPRHLAGCFKPADHLSPGAVQAVFRDVTARRLAEKGLRSGLRILLQLGESASSAVIATNAQGNISYWSTRAENLFGYSRREAAGKNLHALLAPWHDEKTFRQAWAYFHRAGHPEFPDCRQKLLGRNKTGQKVPFELRLCPINIRNRWYAVGFLTDLRTPPAAQVDIEQMAYHDALTGLPNRALLHDRLAQSLAEASRFSHPLAVLFVDLDYFKKVNDALGHAVGDQLLIKVARRLQQCLRNNDTVARMGGDEFVIVLAGFRQPVNLPKILCKILKTLSRPFRIENHDICISASIGVAVFPEDGQTADTLLRNADTAMYVAKKEGGDSYQLFSREMNRTLMARLELESNLRRALEREELFLHFQPCFDLQSGHPMAVEALVRWSHPRRGILTPETFLDTAEEMGLMPAVGEWVLRKACEDCRTWQKLAGRPIPVAVNLSARQFGQLNLTENIAVVLRETGLPPHSLILEIDEATLQQHADRAGNIMRNLSSIGVRWSVDRFGSGYFSLRNLHALPLDILKIDHHFIRNLATSPDNDVLIGTILSLARNLRLTPVAGGVETEQQLRRLLDLGCRRGQGFLFQGPCHANEIKLLLHRPPRHSR